MMKVQQKTSGVVHREAGAHVFCRIRSNFSTVRKIALGAMDATIAPYSPATPFVLIANTT